MKKLFFYMVVFTLILVTTACEHSDTAAVPNNTGESAQAAGTEEAARAKDWLAASKAVLAAIAEKNKYIKGLVGSHLDGEPKIVRTNGMFTVKTAAAHVRTGPGIQYEDTAILKQGARVKAFEKAKIERLTWYHVVFGDGNTGWMSSAVLKAYSAKPAKIINDAPMISQLPELPYGCEITSLAMLLQDAGVNVSKMTLAEQIPKVPFEKNGINGDPNEGYVGNMYRGGPGLGVYHGPVAALAKRYLGARVVDMTGKSWEAVEDQLASGRPVWIIINTRYHRLPPSSFRIWHTRNGDMKVTYAEHSVLVTGYDQTHVYFNDPLAGIKNRAAAKADFVAAWKQMGSQAISYH